MRTVRGVLVMEVMLTAAIFVLIGSGAVVGMVSALNMNRTAQERVAAVNYAQEGLEAVRSIRNQNYNLLVDSSGVGVQRNGTTGVWEFNGSANNTWGKYTRVMTVANAQRDASGNIVASGGTTDYTTKKVTSTVTWDFSPTQAFDVTVSDYLTDWKSTMGGLIVYSDGTNTPIYREYGQPVDAFSTESSAPSGASGLNFVVRTSPVKREAVVAYSDSGGTLRVLCFDGVTWSSEWSVTAGGTGTTRRFDVAYEKTTGDVMVAYSRNAAAVNAVDYRTKSGTSACGSGNWASAASLPTSTTLTSGTAYWIRLERSPVAASNRIAIAWSDSDSDLGAAVWEGSSWGNLPGTTLETNLEYVAAGGDVQSFDLAIENTSGDIMVAWGVLTTGSCSAGSTCMRYRAFSAGAWGAITAIPTVADSATSIDLGSAPNSDAILLAAIDNTSEDFSTAYWSGTAWTGRVNQDTKAAAPVAGSKLVSVAYLVSGATTRGIINYHDNSSNTVGWLTCNGSAACNSESDWTPSPRFNSIQVWYDSKPNPLVSNQLMFTIADNNNNLFAKSLSMTATPTFTWNNADGTNALESVPATLAYPFSFAFWQK